MSLSFIYWFSCGNMNDWLNNTNIMDNSGDDLGQPICFQSEVAISHIEIVELKLENY